MFFKILTSFFFLVFFSPILVSASEIKDAEFAGQFYPANKVELTAAIDGYIEKVNTAPSISDILMIIVPHAGYGYSGQTAAFAYRLIQNQQYKIVIILGTAHRYAFNGFSIYAQGYFSTPLGKIPIDQDFAKSLIDQEQDIVFDEQAFKGEHSVEVQLPFLQRTLSNFKIVPVICGDATLDSCQRFAELLKKTIGNRKDVLVVVSTDMYHGYDLKELEDTDQLTLSYLKKMDSEKLYYGLREEKLQLCGGFGVVTALALASKLNFDDLEILRHSSSVLDSADNQSDWKVGYTSCVIYCKEENVILTAQQKKRLLEIARNAIETYLQTGKRLELRESDPVFLQELGAFVTLSKNKQLRGCIGNIIGNQALYLTIKDMAVESAVQDPRFDSVKLDELKNIKIEISVLSKLEKIDSADKIILGKHGVLVRKGSATGVFLPQVATETDWSKEEFLNRLCVDKAGISASAWKDQSAQLYIFQAEVFSEGESDK